MNKKRRVLFITENASLLSGFGTYGAEILKRLHATDKYDLAEFASYCKPQDPYVRNRPWPVYANAPSGKNKEEDKFFNRSDINQFGLWRFDRVCLDFKPDIVCVPPGTLVMTENGYKEIELIRPGEKVLTHKSIFQKVTENMRRMNKEPLVEIRVNGSCEPLVLTKEHPVYVYRQKPQTNKKKSRQEIYADAMPEFVEAGQINIGDLIISIPPINKIITTYVDVTEYLDDYIIKSDNKVYASEQCSNGIPQKIPLDWRFGRLIGYFITDGGLRDDYHARLHFKVGEERFINDSKELLEQYFNIKSYIQNPASNKNKYILSIGSLTLLNFLKKFIGYPRHIPRITWKACRVFREGVLCGMVRGDGTYAKKCIRLTTTNKYLMNEYRLLCFSVGLRVHSRFKKRYSDKHNTTWELETNGFDCLKLHNIAQKYNRCPIENSRFNTKTSTNILSNGYFVTPVKTINNIDHEGLVYNLSIENDESYTIQQSVVHNCSIRDAWMDNWVADSPVREYFHWIWMPTVDSAPQRPYWIDVFTKCDAVFTYSEFGTRTLQEQGKNKINLKGCASPGIDANIFKPVMDKQAHRNSLGISPDINILGTVMRNQKRKLFPELMQAFRLFLDTTDKEIAKKTFLYLHTSYPEKNGWDLPDLILENGISSKVLATYICKHCKNVFVSFFADARTICKHCGQHSAIFPNVVHGATTEQLVKIYNCFDVYVQYAICLGKDQEVLTKRGWIPISKITTNDWAFTEKGRYRRVLNVWKNLPKSQGKRVLKIKFHGDYDTIIATENHEFYSLTAKDIEPNGRSVRERLGDKLRKNKIIPAANAKQLSELKTGDLLVMTIDDTVEDVSTIDLAPYIGNNDLVFDNFIEVNFSQNTYPRFIKVDNDFCKFLGLYVADGSSQVSSNTNCIKITSHINAQQNIKVAKNIFTRFKDHVAVRKYSGRLAVDTMCNSVIHARCFQDLLKKGVNRQLPNWVTHLSIEKQKQIIIGMFMGDGHYRADRQVSMYSTISHKLAEQLKDILHRCRINYNVRYKDRTKDNLRDGMHRKDIYNFEISSNIQKGEFYSDRRTNTRSIYIGNKLFKSIKSIKEIDYNDNVWNLEVEEDNTFIIKNVNTNNCEGLGIPQIEAAACGIPIMSVDFTAMHDVVKWCKGYPIKVGYVFRELETGADRCYPDNEHFAQLLNKFFKQPNQIRKQKGFQARQGAIKRYNWDETAKKWEDHFDSLELKGKQGKWNSPPVIFQPNMNIPDKMSQEQAIAWVLANIANKPQEIYKFKGMIASRDINFGATFSYGYIQEFDMKKFIAQCKAYIENKNTIEKIKAGMMGLPPVDYIQAAHK